MASWQFINCSTSPSAMMLVALASTCMITKVLAAKRAARSGADTVIASGREANVLPRLSQGKSVGTLLQAEHPPIAARKQWLADHLQMAGRIFLDAGAVKALRDGSSLLPVGVTRIEGEFERGAAVRCMMGAKKKGKEGARGNRPLAKVAGKGGEESPCP